MNPCQIVRFECAICDSNRESQIACNLQARPSDSAVPQRGDLNSLVCTLGKVLPFGLCDWKFLAILRFAIWSTYGSCGAICPRPNQDEVHLLGSSHDYICEEGLQSTNAVVRSCHCGRFVLRQRMDSSIEWQMQSQWNCKRIDHVGHEQKTRLKQACTT